MSPAQALAIATALGSVTVPTALLQVMRLTTTVTGYRVEARSLSGVLESQAEFMRPVPVGGSGTTTHPYQTSICLSLRTPGVGASSRGRLYWPATGVGLDANTYRMDSTVQTATLTGFKTFLSSMETAIKATLPEANLTVWSRKTANFHDVNSLQLGNVIDTQRRRRDQLIEGYMAVAFP